MATPRSVQRTYITLILGNTLAASLIWGINTIFLLDAGLSNFEAFAANAFFTAGMMLFEIPTGIVAGRHRLLDPRVPEVRDHDAEPRKRAGDRVQRHGPRPLEGCIAHERRPLVPH